MSANDTIKNSPFPEKHIPELHFSLFKMFSNCWLSNASRYLDRDIHTISQLSCQVQIASVIFFLIHLILEVNLR